MGRKGRFAPRGFGSVHLFLERLQLGDDLQVLGATGRALYPNQPRQVKQQQLSPECRNRNRMRPQRVVRPAAGDLAEPVLSLLHI